jgi:hypothetical protein
LCTHCCQNCIAHTTFITSPPFWYQCSHLPVSTSLIHIRRKLQVWATWLFYAVLIDLADAVADELSLPFDRISLEMIFRGLYHFSVAYDKGKADDPVKYFAAPENQDLGIVEALRKPVSRLDLSPFPAPS